MNLVVGAKDRGLASGRCVIEILLSSGGHHALVWLGMVEPPWTTYGMLCYAMLWSPHGMVGYCMVTITITIVVSSYYISFRADAVLLVKPNHNHPDCHQL